MFDKKISLKGLLFKINFGYLIFLRYFLHTATTVGAKPTTSYEKGQLDFVDIDAIKVEADYSGPKLENGKITLKFMKDLLEYNKKGKIMHKKYAFTILRDLRNYYRTQPSIVDVKVSKEDNVTFCGHLNGYPNRLYHLFEVCGLPSKTNRYVFNGDFKGHNDIAEEAVKTTFLLFGFKLLHPEAVFINRGEFIDHDEERQGGNDLFYYCDYGHYRRDYGSSENMKNAVWEVYHWLPYAHRINEHLLVGHSDKFFGQLRSLDDMSGFESGNIDYWLSDEDWNGGWDKSRTKILRDLRNYYRTQPPIVDVKVSKEDNVTFFGSLDGFPERLYHLLEVFGFPSKTNRYVFNGDFKGRMDIARESVKTTFLLFGFKVLHPEAVFINRGDFIDSDHDLQTGNDFFEYCDMEYNSKMMNAVWEVCHWLPYAHRFNEHFLVGHSGEFFKKIKSPEDAKEIKSGNIDYWLADEDWNRP